MGDDSLLNRVSNSLANSRTKSLQRFNLIAESKASSNCSVLRLCILAHSTLLNYLHSSNNMKMEYSVVKSLLLKKAACLEGKAAFLCNLGYLLTKKGTSLIKCCFF